MLYQIRKTLRSSAAKRTGGPTPEQLARLSRLLFETARARAREALRSGRSREQAEREAVNSMQEAAAELAPFRPGLFASLKEQVRFDLSGFPPDLESRSSGSETPDSARPPRELGWQRRVKFNVYLKTHGLERRKVYDAFSLEHSVSVDAAKKYLQAEIKGRGKTRDAFESLYAGELTKGRQRGLKSPPCFPSFDADCESAYRQELKKPAPIGKPG